MCGHHRHRRHRGHHAHHVGDATTAGTRTAFPADDLRASDAEREAVIDDLRAHAGEGRLTVEELDDRIGRAHGACTRRELAVLLGDLPGRGRPPRRLRVDARAELDTHLRSYLTVMALLVAIWALTGMGYPWPVWPALGWGVAIVSRASAVWRPGPGPRARRARAEI